MGKRNDTRIAQKRGGERDRDRLEIRVQCLEPLAGVQVADLIDVMNRKFQVALKKFHIIGHSLGAQVAGFAGEKLRKGGKIIGRITGTTHVI